MYRKSTLYAVAALLVIEAAVIVSLPSRMPRAVRALTAAVNGFGAVVVVVYARQRGK